MSKVGERIPLARKLHASQIMLLSDLSKQILMRSCCTILQSGHAAHNLVSLELTAGVLLLLASQLPYSVLAHSILPFAHKRVDVF